jgi:hypothetical protein
MRPGQKVSQLMNIAFDMAAWVWALPVFIIVTTYRLHIQEILGSMSNGATLYLRGKTSKEWRAVMKIVDILIATPSMLLPHDPADYLNIKTIATAGEACPQCKITNHTTLPLTNSSFRCC